ncbi:CMP-N-acetylneuraminate-poly-alpha-2,8-sialyltransferase-like [Amphiura filiformis]|uniref:CMP-N-acetylneuraminate-poly-alpha-2, 8-sialyltransferase-like n=1 Tax=Amphiura filiformis TaxID=82378 RepID=UPI003B224F93
MVTAANLATYRRTCLVLVIVVVFYICSFGIMIQKDCYSFCVGRDQEKQCFSSKFAILVYRDDISTDNMPFLHKYQPSITLPEYLFELITFQYNAEECFIGRHFPDVAIFAPQKSCAIVGNGGILRNSGCGEEIDSHDFIMRLNLAPVTGFISDVGSRAHLNLVNYETLNWLYGNLTQKEAGDIKRDEFLNKIRYLNDSVLWYPKSMDRMDTRYNFQSVAHILRDVYHLPIKMAYSWKPVAIEKYFSLRQTATSGFNMYAIARTFCSHITLYGFYPYEEDDQGRRIQHHYYNDMDFMYRGKVHNFVTEFKQLKTIAEHRDDELRLVVDKCSDGESKRLKLRRKGNNTFVNPIFWFRIPKLIS